MKQLRPEKRKMNRFRNERNEGVYREMKLGKSWNYDIGSVEGDSLGVIPVDIFSVERVKGAEEVYHFGLRV